MGRAVRPTRVIDEARQFDFSRLSYTRTDKRGVIQSANALFAKGTGYDPAQLVGMPQRIVRHPDMPRAVFARLWQRLGADDTACAYIKNLACDGRHYWIFAVMIPVEDGYISVRCNPQGPLLPAIRKIYAALRAAETPDESMEAQLARLDAALAGLGFPDHQSFMADALSEEMRALAGPGTDSGLVPQLMAMRRSLAELADAQVALLGTFQNLYLIPTNMRILASRLEPSGGPVSAISDSYKRIAADLVARLRGTAGRQDCSARELLAQLDGLLFHDCARRLLARAADQFDHDAGFGNPAERPETAMLRDFCAAPPPSGVLTPQELQGRLARLRHEAEAVQRLMAGLDQVRILGEVESGRLRQHDLGLGAVMAQLEEFHGRIRDRLSAMITLTRQMDRAWS
nr:PAS domain S-box protein [Paracoccus sp. Z118]